MGKNEDDSPRVETRREVGWKRDKVSGKEPRRPRVQPKDPMSETYLYL